MKAFRCGSKVLDMSRKTYIMGILNVTPDSFSDGGNYFSAESALERAIKMAQDGADIIDIGGQSTRPGCVKISPDEEWIRLEKVLPLIRNNLPDTVISLDTFYPEVAEKAAQVGIDIINDVSGGNDEIMLIAKKYNLGMIVMFPGNPDDTNSYDRDIVLMAEQFFSEKRRQALLLGLSKEQLCFDPGIGFGKSDKENLVLINATDRLCRYSAAYLMALSRKRVTDIGGTPMEDRVYSTISLDTVAQLKGADILRVHDTMQAVISARAVDRLIKTISE